MEAIILADRNGAELMPLTDKTCVALLPICGKSILEHTLESLIEAGICQDHVVISAFAPEVKAVIGNGERWGMKLSYSTSRGEESPDKILKSLPHFIGKSCLMLRGDVIRPMTQLKDFLQQAQTSPAAFCWAMAENGSSMMLYQRELNHQACMQLTWPAMEKITDGLILSGHINRLDSLASFHRANLDAASGRLCLRLPGKTSALGLTQGRKSRVYPQNIKQGVAHVGVHCSSYPSVQFSGEVVIGDNVIIDRSARLENTVVMPNTYVGELVELRNAIVRGNDLIRVDMGSILKVRDVFLLADLNTTPISQGLETINRGLGGILLLLSVPLWLLAGVCLLFERPEPLMSLQTLRGNKILLNEFGLPERGEFSCGEFNLKAPVLRYLPRLLAVFSGDLRLVGVLPVTLETASKRQADWEIQVNHAPAGLIGPTQLSLPKQAAEEERMMSDSFYWAHFSIRQDLRYLLLGFKTLFSSKAWS
jgi:NDP-sugar pyrophosphorylase family protein